MNADATILQVSPKELRTLLEAGVPLLDVRTPPERAFAKIEESMLLDEEIYPRLLTLDRETPLAFYCHYGLRSQQAAEHFLDLGFRELYNLAGGIDAWSREIDTRVPRY